MQLDQLEILEPFTFLDGHFAPGDEAQLRARITEVSARELRALGWIRVPESVPAAAQVVAPVPASEADDAVYGAGDDAAAARD